MSNEFQSEYWVSVATAPDKFKDLAIHINSWEMRDADTDKRAIYYNIRKKYISDLVLTDATWLIAENEDEIIRAVETIHRIDPLTNRVYYDRHRDRVTIQRARFRQEMIPLLVQRKETDPSFVYKVTDGTMRPVSNFPDGVRCYFTQEGLFDPANYDLRWRKLQSYRKTRQSNITKETARRHKEYEAQQVANELAELERQKNPTLDDVENRSYYVKGAIQELIQDMASRSIKTIKMPGLGDVCIYRLDNYADFKPVYTRLIQTIEASAGIGTWKRYDYRGTFRWRETMRIYGKFRIRKPTKRVFAKELPDAFKWLEREFKLYRMSKGTK
jgi:hypothetical protein